MGNKVPVLRFKGFTDPWEQRKLGDLGKVFTGNTPKTSENENWTSDGTGHVWITPTDIQQLHTSNSDRHLSDIGWEKARVVPEKSVLITSIASIGKNTINTVPAAFNQQINAIVPEGADAEFILAVMEKESARFASLAGQTATAIINKTEFEKFKINAPSFDEQIRIGELFSKVDMLIAANQRKLDLLKEQKKGCLQKMFPKNGAKVPELRFAGFSGDWEQRKLGDLGSVQMNKRIFKDQTSESGEVPFFKIGTFGKKPDSFISKKLFDEYKSKYPYPKVGDILISASGSIGRTVVYKGEDAYFQDSNIVWLEHDGRLKNSFLEQFLKRTKWNKIEGSTIKRLYNKDILNKKINLPKLKEQEKIGSFFKQLDDTIDLHQRKLEKLQELKKGCLQKMFC